jgi:hypothetical protein
VFVHFDVITLCAPLCEMAPLITAVIIILSARRRPVTSACDPSSCLAAGAKGIPSKQICVRAARHDGAGPQAAVTLDQIGRF